MVWVLWVSPDITLLSSCVVCVCKSCSCPFADILAASRSGVKLLSDLSILCLSLFYSSLFYSVFSYSKWLVSGLIFLPAAFLKLRDLGAALLNILNFPVARANEQCIENAAHGVSRARL
jgi:hypothetical protein